MTCGHHVSDIQCVPIAVNAHRRGLRHALINKQQGSMQVNPSDGHCLGLFQLRADLDLTENLPAVDGLNYSKRLVAILMKNYHFQCVCVLVAQLCPTLCDPMDYSPQAPLSMGFFRQEYWSGLPCPPPRDLPEPGIEPRSPALQADSLQSEPPGNPSLSIIVLKMTYFIISFFFFF